MDVTEEMTAAQSKRLADGIASVSNGIDDLRAENRRLRDALFQFTYPPDPKTLREIADEIDCGEDCCRRFYECDTGYTGCSHEDHKDGCAFSKASELRQFAEAIEAQADLRKSFEIR